MCQHDNIKIDCVKCYQIQKIALFIYESIDQVFVNARYLSLDLVGQSFEQVHWSITNSLLKGMEWKDFNKKWSLGWRVPILYNNPDKHEIVNRFNWRNIRVFWKYQSV